MRRDLRLYSGAVVCLFLVVAFAGTLFGNVNPGGNWVELGDLSEEPLLVGYFSSSSPSGYFWLSRPGGYFWLNRPEGYFWLSQPSTIPYYPFGWDYSHVGQGIIPYSRGSLIKIFGGLVVPY